MAEPVVIEGWRCTEDDRYRMADYLHRTVSVLWDGRVFDVEDSAQIPAAVVAWLMRPWEKADG